MAYNKEGVLRKITAMVSALYALVIWVARLSSLMQFLKALSLHHYLQLPFALTTLIFSITHQNSNLSTFNAIRSYLTLPSLSPASGPPTPLPSPATSSSSSILSLSFLDDTNTSSPTSSWSTPGDLIGTESGIIVSKDHDFELPTPETKPYPPTKTLRTRQRETMMRKFPPPIPLLVRTGKFRARMPWVLNKDSTIDDRCILREIRSDRYEFFETKRENGRLVLKLVRPAPVQCGLIPPEVIRQDVEEEDIDVIEEEIEVNKGKKKMEGDDHMVQEEAMVSSPSPSSFALDAMVQAGSPSMTSSMG